MPSIVTVASGKGGVGKSVVISNLGLALAARGHRVVLADLDVGGCNLGTLFGAFETGPDLDKFFSREIDLLQETLRPIRPGLSLIVGAGETLATANPNWAMKQRLLRHLANLDADVVLVDVGAGAGTHALDFYNAGDLRILVTLPEPTASVDGYRFLKLATIREAATRISSRNPERRQLERQDFMGADQVWRTIATNDAERPVNVPQFVIVNQAQNTRIHFKRLQLVTRRFLGRDLQLLGEIPRDESVVESVVHFLPIIEGSPLAPAAKSIREIAGRLEDEVVRHSIGHIASPIDRSKNLPELAGLVEACSK